MSHRTLLRHNQHFILLAMEWKWPLPPLLREILFALDLATRNDLRRNCEIIILIHVIFLLLMLHTSQITAYV